jgi:glycine betaine/proline transport system substrate-binding protein
VVVAAVGLGSAFSDTIPAPIEAFLDAFYLQTATINEMLAFMEANDAGTQEAALAFMRESPEVWGAWLADVDPAVTERVLGALE